MPNIYVPETLSKMRAWRKEAQDCYKEKYEMRVAPYRSLLLMYCRRGRVGPGGHQLIDPVEGANELLELLRRKGKMQTPDRQGHFRAVMFSSCIDIIERDLMNPANFPRIIRPDISDGLNGIVDDIMGNGQ